MKRTLITLFLALATAGFAAAQGSTPTIDQAAKDRAAALVKQMTLEEKCFLITGQEDGFHTAAIERLGIPSVRMADGPQGVRNKTRSTYYPCGISLAASFNKDVAKAVGTGIGHDACARGVRIMLCPGVNIYRSPLCGRNFEYYGEDPYLASETALNYIQGIQEQRVVATIKHFVANNQEFNRHGVNSQVGERALNEIYFPSFRKAVEQGKVGAVMTSYNPVNGKHAPENDEIIGGALRKWGHEGIVMSDWTSTYSTTGCVEGGLDLEMSQGYVMNYQMVKPLVENGTVDEGLIDLKCQHILQTFIAYGLLDLPMKDSSIPEDYAPSREAAYQAALEGPVLLKNEGMLPVRASRKNNIVVLGPNADIIAYGGGSGEMDPIEGRTTTLWEGMSRLDAKKYKSTLVDWQNLDSKAEEAISKASAVIVSVGFTKATEKEGSDRTYALPEGQNELISKVAALNSNVTVVINSGGEVDITPWKDSVKAIIFAWYAGQDGGRALADIISGKVSPSGKLPFTFWGSEQANPLSKWYHTMVPVIKKKSKNRDTFAYVEYGEGVFVGYRGVEHFGVKPMYPFGYGLSYSSFQYSDLELTANGKGYILNVTVTNTGSAEASEVAQVYVAPVSPACVRPERELKGYAKTKLAAGASARLSIELPESAFEHYDVASHSWKADAGSYRILVGASSADIRLEETVSIR